MILEVPRPGKKAIPGARVRAREPGPVFQRHVRIGSPGPRRTDRRLPGAALSGLRRGCLRLAAEPAARAGRPGASLDREGRDHARAMGGGRTGRADRYRIVSRSTCRTGTRAGTKPRSSGTRRRSRPRSRSCRSRTRFVAERRPTTSRLPDLPMAFCPNAAMRGAAARSRGGSQRRPRKPAQEDRAAPQAGGDIPGEATIPAESDRLRRSRSRQHGQPESGPEAAISKPKPNVPHPHAKPVAARAGAAPGDCDGRVAAKAAKPAGIPTDRRTRQDRPGAPAVQAYACRTSSAGARDTSASQPRIRESAASAPRILPRTVR